MSYSESLAATGVGRRRGFTMIELIVVIAILGILFGVAVPSLEGLSPKYRLRSSARKLASKINEVRSLAGGIGKSFALHYDIQEGAFWVILPPEAGEDPEQPLDDRRAMTPVILEEGVVIEKIMLPDGESISDGEFDLVFDALGHQGSHIVYLRNNEDELIALKFNALLGVVDIFQEEIEFERFR